MLGAMNSNTSDINKAMDEAHGYNIISSKSHKMLPLNKHNEKQLTNQRTQNASQGLHSNEKPNNVEKERMRVSASFKSILQREQARDE